MAVVYISWLFLFLSVLVATLIEWYGCARRFFHPIIVI
jgi:hypothetical protein